jgi:hypothetical protein
VKRIAWFAAGLASLLACATSSPPGGKAALEPRFIAVHNTLAAMGMAQVGPIQHGSLGEGRETRYSVDLPSDCATVIAIGTGEVRDLDLIVLDADDKQVGRDATSDSEAAVKVCPIHGGRFSLVVKMAKGSGDFVIASWSGAPNPNAPAAAQNALAEAAGTCDAPIPLAAGVVNGSTRKGNAEHTGNNCGNSEAKELIYKLELEKRSRVLLEVDPTFDSVLYVRKDDCAEPDAQVACNDDAPAESSGKTTHASRIEEVFDAGTYFVFVDGYQAQVGNFKLKTEIADVPTLADECRQQKPLSQHAQGSLTGNFDAAKSACDAGKGPEIPYRLDVPARARTRVVLQSDDFSPELHLRKSCVDEATEVACGKSGMKSTEGALVTTLDAGSYTVFADSAERGQHGAYKIDVDLTTPTGQGVRGDSCSDAIPLALDDKLVAGDTFEAKDDFSGTCAARDAPDMMYRFELTSRSRVTAFFDSEEGNHVFTLFKSCTDRTSEIACKATLDEVLSPGVYFVAVDGTEKGPFGRFTFRLRAKDVSLQDAACKAPAAITLGQTVQGTTAGVPDRFNASCGGKLDAQTSGDRVFRLVVPTRQHIQLLLSTPSFDGLLALRKTCLDPPNMKSPREAEVICNNDAPDTRHSKIDTTVDAGTYYVVVDGHLGKNEGPFTLEAKAIPTLHIK